MTKDFYTIRALITLDDYERELRIHARKWSSDELLEVQDLWRYKTTIPNSCRRIIDVEIKNRRIDAETRGSKTEIDQGKTSLGRGWEKGT